MMVKVGVVKITWNHGIMPTCLQTGNIGLMEGIPLFCKDGVGLSPTPNSLCKDETASTEKMP